MTSAERAAAALKALREDAAVCSHLRDELDQHLDLILERLAEAGVFSGNSASST